MPSTNAAPTGLPGRAGGVGQATVERMISQTRRDMGKLMLFGGGALMLVLLLAAWKFWPTSATPVTTLITGDPNVLTPGQVAEKYSSAVVSIDVRWKLINTNTGRQIFHVYVPNRWKGKDGVEDVVNACVGSGHGVPGGCRLTGNKQREIKACT